MMEGVIQTAEISWLAARLRENKALVPLSKADLLTDTAIQWWIKKNPKAETTASKLTFGQLDPESSLVEAFKKARKEKGKNVNAAQFDVRGYTVICIQNRKEGNYTLVWCEPVCRNKKTDKYLDTFFFESDGTTLDLIYYRFAFPGLTALEIAPASRRRNRNTLHLPTISPYRTKKLSPERSSTVPSRTASCHQGVRSSTLPHGSMMALMPVLPQRATHLRVSMARSRL